MKTLLQINVSCNFGSTGRIAEQIGQLAISKGWNSYIAYARGFGGSESETIKIGSKLDIVWHGAMSRLFDRHGLASTWATKRLVAKIKKINPDVVHLHNIHGYYINYRILFDALKQMDAKIVWTFHDAWPCTGHCAGFDFLGCDGWKDGCSNCQHKGSYPRSILLNRAEKNYRIKRESFTGLKDLTIVTPSKWLANLVKQSFLRDYPVKVINNGIDLSSFRPIESDFRESHGLEGKVIVLGVSSVWGRSKGLNDYISLAAKLDSRYQIVLVGVSHELSVKLKDVGIIGIEKTHNVRELAEIYTAADVFLNLTLQDNYPTVNLEARACGLPVITYRTGGSPESAGPDAIVVEQSDLDGVVKALNSLDFSQKRPQNPDHSSFDSKQKFEEYIKLYNT